MRVFRMNNGNDDEVASDGTADPARDLGETSTHTRDGAIPASYGEPGGTVAPTEGDPGR